jgi:hypothetical protein
LVLRVVAVVAVLGCLVGGVFAVRGYLGAPGRADVGNCLADAGGRPGYRLVDCDDQAARYRVLTVSEADGNPCVDVPGASRLYSIDDKVFCVGRKDADPAKSANIAKNGDCLRIGRDVEAERLDCADPKANVKVLRRLTDVTYDVIPGVSEGPCADTDVPDTVLTYAYDWESDTPPNPHYSRRGKHADLLFCLARINEPPPAVPDAHPSCRYVSGDAVLAAVNAAVGTRYVEVEASFAGDGTCVYQIGSGRYLGGGIISIKLNADTTWPPLDAEEFDIDGLKAAWETGSYGDPQSGRGHLYIDRQTGRFEIVLGFDTFAATRELAIAIYRAAAPHVP